MKKISLKIAGKVYDINIEDEISEDLKKHLNIDFDIDKNNSIKTLLEAYLKKNYELILVEKRLKKLLDKINSIK